jgi:hypothetical protein
LIFTITVVENDVLDGLETVPSFIVICEWDMPTFWCSEWLYLYKVLLIDLEISHCVLFGVLTHAVSECIKYRPEGCYPFIEQNYTQCLISNVRLIRVKKKMEDFGFALTRSIIYSTKNYFNEIIIKKEKKNIFFKCVYINTKIWRILKILGGVIP